ncbi:MAG: protein arginine kinase [Firmicutes bacterium]|nr:protein arginine kinase [Bacillota bacterium]
MDSMEHFFSKWMEDSGPEAEIVLSSRVRLARNIKKVPFPYLASDSQTQEVLDIVTRAASKGGDKYKDFRFIKMHEISSLERKVLVEKHLISPLLAKQTNNGAVLLRKDESVSIMINEEDHLRLQSLLPGLQLEQALKLINEYDDKLESVIDYAVDERYGYLTTCPTNVGTGMRASVMLHLPGLVLTKQIDRILTAIPKVGLAVRGLYGEGTEMVGNLLQISNQVTLGQSEGEIIRNIYGVTRQIIKQEEQARQSLLNEGREKLADRVFRALGILKYARLITSAEAMRLLSDLRLGLDLGLVTELNRRMVNELMVIIRPACLQYISKKELPPRERDVERAVQIRRRIAAVSGGK